MTVLDRHHRYPNRRIRRAAGTAPTGSTSPSSSPWSPASAVGILAPEVGKSVGVLGTMFVCADQDDDRAGHLLHDRAGHRLGAQGRDRRQGRRPGLRLLPGHVDVRARDRPRRRQPDPPRQRHAPDGDRCGQGRRTRREGARVRRPAGLRSGHHPGHAVLVADRRQRAAGAVRRAARRLRAAGHGHRGRADPARHRAPAEAGLQDPRDDPVAGPDRRIRRDRQRRRPDRLDRGDPAADADARLLRRPACCSCSACSARCCARCRVSRSSSWCATWPASTC